MARRSAVLASGAAIALAFTAAACSGSVGSVGSGSPSAPVPVSATPGGAAAGSTRTDEHGIVQVWVPAGTFTMGTDGASVEPPTWATAEAAAERPAHEVALSAGYWIDRTEVTNAAYAAFVAAGGYTTRAFWSEDGWTWLERQDKASLPQSCGDTAPDHPRVCITWFEAQAYAAWRGGTLPTEAQWEYAARGPASSVYPWGNAWDPSKANVVDSTALTTVGTYPAGASWVGALDLSGNAMEWVADWYSTTYYGQLVRDDPTGPVSGTRKVEKGGWWGAVPYVARAAYRHFEDPPTYRDHHIGVRIVSTR
jgi:formylglycine-generating enzyme required for sulfatase activity